MIDSANQWSGIGNERGCTCCKGSNGHILNGISRREFLHAAGASALGTVALSGLSLTALASFPKAIKNNPGRAPLVVKPVFTYEIPIRREQTSWRVWGGIQTENDADQEIARIREELETLKAKADFPVEFLPVARVSEISGPDGITDIQAADLILVYAAGGRMDILDTLHKTGKQMLFFCRHKSGPVYLWYEIISPKFLRRRSDNLSVAGIDEDDVVIDDQDEILWRLRALCGLKNTLGTNIIAIGGPSAWGQQKDIVPNLVREKFKFGIISVPYDELGKLIIKTKAEKSVVSRAKKRADEYLDDTKIQLGTKRRFVENCFVLEDILSQIMEGYDCQAITINSCMGTIMPLCETSACLTLSLLNDAGYMAFCESDFVAIPAGILLAGISGKPVFFNDPTYPHNGIITLAHCTAPRRMDGKNLEPARILTHFESDYGAAPKVEMCIGQTVTSILPDFAVSRYTGLLGKIVDNPFMDICRSQIDISFECDSKLVAKQMCGFHWLTVYGDYIRESGYALKKTGIGFEILA